METHIKLTVKAFTFTFALVMGMDSDANAINNKS